MYNLMIEKGKENFHMRLLGLRKARVKGYYTKKINEKLSCRDGQCGGKGFDTKRTVLH